MWVSRCLVMLGCLMATSAMAAQKRHIWECRTANEGAQPILHLVEWGPRSYVKFAHVRFGAVHHHGDDAQGWYFDNDGSGFYRYGLVLDDDHKAWLHDFKDTDDDGLSTPLDHFYCAKIV